VGGTSFQRKAINYQLVADAIPQAISSMKHGVVEGCNVTVPKIINLLLFDDDTLDDFDQCLLDLIYKAYIKLFVYIVNNRENDMDKATKIVYSHIQDGLKPLNIRDNQPIYNSADTDRAILKNSTDMAVLLATTKSFLSNISEFDIVNM
jgi:hypothetical protein